MKNALRTKVDFLITEWLHETHSVNAFAAALHNPAVAEVTDINPQYIYIWCIYTYMCKLWNLKLIITDVYYVQVALKEGWLASRANAGVVHPTDPQK